MMEGGGCNDNLNPSGTPCELCGYLNNNSSRKNPSFHLLEVIDTPSSLVINYQCPSCSLRVVEAFQGNVGRIKVVLEGMVRDLIGRIRQIKKDTRGEEAASKRRIRGRSPSSSWDFDDKSPTPDSDNRVEEEMKMEVKEEEVEDMDYDYLVEQGVLTSNGEKDKLPENGGVEDILSEDDVEQMSSSSVSVKERNYLCQKCGKAFKTSTGKSVHMRGVHGEELFKCSKCPDVSFKTKNSLNRHLCSTHGEKWPLRCHHSGCGKGFLFQRELNHHKDIWHSEGKYVCPHAGCGKEFPHNKFLKAHEELHTKGITSLKCETCGKEYDNYKSFKKHQKLHEQTLQFPCSQCSKIFTSNVSLKGHIDRHKGLRKFQCEDCGRSFPSSGNLRTHQRHVHERGGKPRPTRVGRLENSGDGTG